MHDLTEYDYFIDLSDDHQDAGFELSEAVLAALRAEFPDRLYYEEFHPDMVHMTIPGRTILVDNLSEVTLAEFASRIVPTLVRDVHHQLNEQGLDPANSEWAIKYEWLCHLIFELDRAWRGRFDFAVEVGAPATD